MNGPAAVTALTLRLCFYQLTDFNGSAPALAPVRVKKRQQTLCYDLKRFQCVILVDVDGGRLLWAIQPTAHGVYMLYKMCVRVYYRTNW